MAKPNSTQKILAPLLLLTVVVSLYITVFQPFANDVEALISRKSQLIDAIERSRAAIQSKQRALNALRNEMVGDDGMPFYIVEDSADISATIRNRVSAYATNNGLEIRSSAAQVGTSVAGDSSVRVSLTVTGALVNLDRFFRAIESERPIHFIERASLHPLPAKNLNEGERQQFESQLLVYAYYVDEPAIQ